MKRALALAPNGKSKSDRSPYAQGSSLYSDSGVSAYSFSSNRDYSPHCWESSVHLDSRASAYSVPGPGPAYSGYPAASPGVRVATGFYQYQP